jgi:hypothetical protein
MSEASPIGFVKLHRKLLKWEWIGDPNIVTVLVHVMLRVNREPKRWQGIDIPIGSFLTSRSSLAASCGLTEKQVRRALDKLEEGRTIDKVRAGSGLLISLVKWEEYQENGTAQGRTRADDGQESGPDEGRTRATTKEVKKLRSREVESGAAKPPRDADWFKEECKKVVEEFPDVLVKSERAPFFDYWTEPSETGRLRFAAQKFFDFKRRMQNWQRRANEKQTFNGKVLEPVSPTAKPWTQ